jgi:LmbE family N-acetylglucosaminyl deacetylase
MRRAPNALLTLARLLLVLPLVVAAPTTSRAANGYPRPNDPLDGAHLRAALERLQVVGGALYVGAHPDDENTALLAEWANGRKVRAAYLSMTRGDGGQNLIGTEIGEQLGVIRTQELLEARRVDGAEQFFTRALDFGFSKKPEETLAFWGHDRMLADVVWVIRRFQPDVIVTRFATDGSGGHGHHTASAILAEEAFAAAADPKRFPEQLQWVKPWQAKRLMWNAYRFGTMGADTTRGRLHQDLGAYDALLGRSYTEIAGESRSMHKSQGFGAAERRGAWDNSFEHRLGDRATSDLFDGVDLSWKRVPGGERVGALLAEAERSFDPAQPAALLPLLAKAHAAMAGLPSDPRVDAKRAELLEVMRSCAGLWIEADAATPSTIPGARLPVTVTVLNRSDAGATLDGVELLYGATGKPAGVAVGGKLAGTALAPNLPVNAEAVVAIPADMPITQPYWLRAPMLKGSFEVADPRMIGLPENPAPLVARVRITLAGEPLVFDAPVVYRWVDPVLGERYRPIEIGPPATCRFDQGVYLFPDLAPREMRVVVECADTALDAVTRLKLPAGWKAEPASAPVKLAGRGSEQSLRFTVTPAAGPAAATVAAEVETRGRRYSYRHVVIDHPHIPVETLFPPAEARLVRVDLRHAGDQVAYVMGPGDQGPDALRQIGYHVTMLADDEVENADLSRYDAVVVGVRAYNTRPRLKTLQKRLLAYCAQGGRLVLQYDTADDNLKDALGPWPFTISRDRVTVEEAEMRVLKPGHPLLATPNTIGPDDFKGWVQERGLYYANPWDPRYETVFSANDPGETPKDGGLLFARYGKGTFIYTGLSWFRQLPAGVPGAWRLFANLVSPDRQP